MVWDFKNGTFSRKSHHENVFVSLTRVPGNTVRLELLVCGEIAKRSMIYAFIATRFPKCVRWMKGIGNIFPTIHQSQNSTNNVKHLK